MEEEKVKKLQYINENLIEKGYNPEELSNYIIKKLGIPMDNLKFDQLKEMIEQFKDQSLQDTYKSVKTKNVGKQESTTDILYAPQAYDVKTQTQQNNKLLDLDKNNILLKVEVTDPKKEKSGGFLKKAIYSYKVTCPELKTEVRRVYSDFEWLREQLLLRYSLRLVTPVIKENLFTQSDFIDKQDNEETIEAKKAKHLNAFINNLISKKIFRTSPLVLEFLELEEERFGKYKNLVEKNKYEMSIMLDNLKTLKGKIHFEIKKEDIQKATQFNKKYSKLSEIYSKLDKNISAVVADFNNLEIHMKELSEQFNKLNEQIKENQHAKKMEEVYTQLNIIFSSWSASYGKQSAFFKEDFKSLFKYMNLESMEMNSIYKSFVSFKNEYEDFTTRINKKKEELFESKDYSKWSLKPGTEDQLPMFQNNKKIAFEKMLHKETFLLSEEKKRVACSVYYLFKEYDLMLKHQSENLSNYFEALKKNNSVIGDAHNLIKLFSIKKTDV